MQGVTGDLEIRIELYLLLGQVVYFEEIITERRLAAFDAYLDVNLRILDAGTRERYR